MKALLLPCTSLEIYANFGHVARQGTTWQQAIQWVDEVKAEPGSSLALLAKHDTYSIKFAWQSPPGTNSSTSHTPNADREMGNVQECLPAHVSNRRCEDAPQPNEAMVPLKVNSA